MTTFIEMHALRSFPPSNLNRDDLGTPKTAVFGGARRLRISSQCLKRTWRMSEHFRGAFAEEQLGVRTDRLPEEVFKLIGDTVDGTVREGLLALLGSIGRRAATQAHSGDDDNSDTDDNTTDATKPPRTAHVLFLSRQEIEAIADFSRANGEALTRLRDSRPADGNTRTGKRIDPRAVETLRRKLQTYLETHTAKNAVDVGLFGRFMTSGELDTVEGALQVAHGLGTQKIEIEYDYFTAVDDLSTEPGAAHIGESEFASSVLYLYACCDFTQLKQNLGARTANGRVPDDEARAMAKKALPALVRAMAVATPTGKRNGTAPHTPAQYVEVVVRQGAPLSFANAFLKPVDSGDCSGGDVMSASILRFAAHRDQMETAYGRGPETLTRWVMCLSDIPKRDGALVVPDGCAVTSIEDLARKLGTTLDLLGDG